MLWLTRQTRSGGVFGHYSLPTEREVNSLYTRIDCSPLIADAAARILDAELTQRLNSVDDEAHPTPPDDLPDRPSEPKVASSIKVGGRRHVRRSRSSSRSPTPPPTKKGRGSSPTHNPCRVVAKLSRKQKSNSAANQRRRDRNARKREHNPIHQPSPGVVSKIVAVATGLPFMSHPAHYRMAEGAYTGKHTNYGKRGEDPSYPWTAEELKKEGFRYEAWDGIQPRPLLDVHNRVFAVLVGRPPKATNWDETCSAVADELEKERRGGTFTAGQCFHRRGEFPALMYGITMGGGSTFPIKYNAKARAPMLERLVSNKHVLRLASYGSFSFSVWAPQLYSHYHETLEQMYAHSPHLRPERISAGSVFPCWTFNFGPHTRCYKHTDDMNLPYGWCCIQSLGNFDPTKGGHLVLWDLGIVVEFPPGATVLIPSASITHSNTPVQEHETRYSFTQYCAGGIFRWVDNGFRSNEEFQTEDPLAFKSHIECVKERNKTVVGQYLSTLDDLRNAPATSVPLT